ncbi:alkaline phosphatase family protein [Calothrix sp. 336/3]|uniref:alkaline phosphatase family protein n=1 Tax=Calothrix sp. 336/3 TaxID=1337936 RepID=UPI0004E45FCE|nr:alkaline phosphatase family protein [Calothrix sp. 336/3]AKG22672.1 AP protein [Calothrix sp. 336/3]
MTPISAIAETALLHRQTLPGIFGKEAVRPSYDGLGLANIAALVPQLLIPEAVTANPQATLPAFNPSLLGIDLVTSAWQNWLNQSPINHVVMVLIDGLGYDQLQTLIVTEDAPGFVNAVAHPQAFFMPITSVYPSTTVTALTSAATAHPPAKHGIVGTNLYFSEIGSVVNLIHFCPSVAPTRSPLLDTQLNPDTLVPVANIYRTLESAGVDVKIINFHQFKQTSISRYTCSGSAAGKEGFSGYLTPADGFAQVRNSLLANSDRGKTFTYIYLYHIDSIAHRHGPLSPSYRAEVAAIAFALERELLKPLSGKNDTVMLLSADHGQRYCYPEKTMWLNDHPELMRMLFVPSAGETRCKFLYLKHGKEQAALNYIEKHLQDNFLAITKSEAVELGLFGLPGESLTEASGDRMGDILLIPNHDWICRHHLPSEEPSPYVVGIHGGLSRAEMLIPFLAYRF